MSEKSKENNQGSGNKNLKCHAKIKPHTASLNQEMQCKKVTLVHEYHHLTTMVVWTRKLSRIECYDTKNLTALQKYREKRNQGNNLIIHMARKFISLRQ